MIFGIKLRNAFDNPENREIGIRGDELVTFEQGVVRKRSLFQTITSRVSGGENVIDLFSNSPELLYVSKVSTGEFSEFFRTMGGIKERVTGTTLDKLGSYVRAYPSKHLMIEKSGSLIDSIFVPTQNQDIVPKEVTDSYFTYQGTYVPLNQPEMEIGFRSSVFLDPHVKGDEVLYIKLSETEPNEGGVLWNNNGVVDISPYFKMIVKQKFKPTRVTATGGEVQIKWLSYQTWEISSKDPITHLDYGYKNYQGHPNWETTSVEIIRSGTLTSLEETFAGLNEVVSFTCPVGSFLNVINFRRAWYHNTKIESFPQIDTSSGTNFDGAWGFCWKLTEFPLIDTRSAVNLAWAWVGCEKLTSFPLIDTSSCVSIFSSWDECKGLTSFPLIDTSNVENFISTWMKCEKLASFPLIDTSNATSLDETWRGCLLLTSFPMINTSSVTSLDSTWESCHSLTEFPLLDTSSCTNFRRAFSGCSSLTLFPLLDTSNVTNFGGTWNNCSGLIQFPQIDSSKVVNFEVAWGGCTSLTSFPPLDTSSGIDFGETWWECRSLTSFPHIEVDGTDFIRTWYNCISLPHCPMGNEVALPNLPGINTTDMCTNI